MPEMTSGVAGSSWGRGNYGSPGGKDGVLGKRAHAEKWATGLNEQCPAEHDCAPRGPGRLVGQQRQAGWGCGGRSPGTGLLSSLLLHQRTLGWGNCPYPHISSLLKGSVAGIVHLAV